MSQTATLETLSTDFRRQFHIDLPEEFRCDGLCDVGLGRLLSTGSSKIVTRLLVERADKTVKENLLPPNHHTVGWWGHGVNSYAFYFICKRADAEIYLRLHVGGAYTDPDSAAGRIADYIPAFIRLLRKARELNGHLQVMESMGRGHYSFALDGKLWAISASLLGDPACNEEMDSIVSLRNSAEKIQHVGEIEAIRGRFLATARQLYDVEMRRSGNERVGMRAMGEAMRVIRAVRGATMIAEFQHELFWSLNALKERYSDSDGEHDYGRQCIERLLTILRSAG